MSKIELKPSYILNSLLSIIALIAFVKGFILDKPIYEYSFLDHVCTFVFYATLTIACIILVIVLSSIAAGDLDSYSIKINNPFAKSKKDVLHEKLGQAYMKDDKVLIAELEKEFDELD